MSEVVAYRYLEEKVSGAKLACLPWCSGAGDGDEVTALGGVGAYACTEYGSGTWVFTASGAEVVACCSFRLLALGLKLTNDCHGIDGQRQLVWCCSNEQLRAVARL